MNNCSVRPKNTDLWHPVRNNIPAYPWHPAPARRQDVADTGTSIQRSCLSTCTHRVRVVFRQALNRKCICAGVVWLLTVFATVSMGQTTQGKWQIRPSESPKSPTADTELVKRLHDLAQRVERPNAGRPTSRFGLTL